MFSFNVRSTCFTLVALSGLAVAATAGAAQIDEVTSQPATLQSTTGAIFKRVTGNAFLGEAWQDPRGVIWGDVVNDILGDTKYLTVGDAEAYCETQGARLASYDDLVALQHYFGKGTHAGYKPQILPNLVNSWFIGQALRYHAALTFYGGGGEIDSVDDSTPAAFRCVVSAQ